MGNPAQTLHSMLTAWNSDRLARDSRGLNTSDADQLAASTANLRIAAMHLSAIDDFIRGMAESGSNTTMWEQALDRWTRGVFLYPYGWEKPQPHSVKNEDLELLYALGELMQLRVPVLKPEGSKIIREFLDKIEETASEEAMDVALQRHLKNLLLHIRWCLDNYATVGDFELEKALQQLAATLTLAKFETEKTGKESRFTTFINNWINPFTVGALAGMTGNLSSTAFLALTS
ncbi:hypothetical protein PAB09_00180 [Corynebacterium sp. SCR221107]|uniref:hypothetical protein n=1 Tax=Corynebacterium sp. SCR221107 TaxID=3017361 RepID=UPI0022EC2B72|nr:hypothetical protein [Corynebacterium sp. SCR221107]WBT08820.1 hypothetical protein PAB09_00180 [Corynebacterium sp. SCR221107]